MTARRALFVRVGTAACALVAAAALLLPLAATFREDEAGAPFPREDGAASGADVVNVATVLSAQSALPLPGSYSALAEVEALRARGDVAALLALARATPAEPSHSARLRIIALASIGAIPGPEASSCLQALVLSKDALELDRLTALGALWERGERVFVEAVARDASDDALRSKAQALIRARH